MIYKFDQYPQHTPFYYWSCLFASLSTKLFELVYDALDFPFSPSEMLRQTAHDFVVAKETLLHNPVPEEALIDFLEGIMPDDPFPKKCEILFADTFVHLEKQGYADLVYQWGKQTRNYYRSADIEVLSAWCKLLGVWARQEWVKQPLQTIQEPLLSTWKNKVRQIADDGWDDYKLAALNITGAAHTQLQTILVNNGANLLRLSQTREQIMASPRSKWDDFALRRKGGNTWIHLEGRFRSDLRTWNMIMDTLSSDEMHILEEWGSQHQSQFRNLVGTLPNVRKREK